VRIVFCVVPDEQTEGDYSLWTKSADQKDECVPVVAVVPKRK